MESVAAILTALGVGAVLTKLTEWFIQTQKARREDKKAFTKVFNAIKTLYSTLMTMLRESKAHRVILLKTTNGGGKPRLTGKLYSSIMYEAFESPLRSIKDKWEKQELDQAYMMMLFEMNKTGVLEVRTSEMQDGILKTLYTKDKIIKSLIYRIHERETEYIYLSVNFTEEEKEIPAISDVFRVGIMKLENLFGEHAEI